MDDFELPPTRYALSGDVSIAYQTIGDGPIDLILVPGIVSHVEFAHEMPNYTQWLRRLGKFARIVTFDKRGQGLSDRVPGAASLDERMDDLNAIMGAIGSSRVALLGFSEGSAMSALFAATYPERVSHLVMFGGFANRRVSDDWVEERVKHWGEGETIRTAAVSLAGDPAMVRSFGKFERLSASPGAIRAFMQLLGRIDVRPILPTLRTPTLVLHRRADAMVPIKYGREYAQGIPGARLIEYDGGDHLPWIGDYDAPAGDIEEFLTGRRESEDVDTERVLATVLFTDIVELDTQGDGGRRSAMAPLARRTRPYRAPTRREASRPLDQEHRRRHARHFRRSRSGGALCARARTRGAADRPVAARRAAYRRDRTARRRCRRSSRPCRLSRDVAIGTGRSAGLARGQRTHGRRRPEIHRARRAQLKGLPGAWELFAASA